jgi:hypothetical protein
MRSDVIRYEKLVMWSDGREEMIGVGGGVGGCGLWVESMRWERQKDTKRLVSSCFGAVRNHFDQRSMRTTKSKRKRTVLFARWIEFAQTSNVGAESVWLGLFRGTRNPQPAIRNLLPVSCLAQGEIHPTPPTFPIED